VNGIWTMQTGEHFTPGLAAAVSNSAGGGGDRPDRIRDGNLASGQRTIEAHPTTVSDAAVCLEPGTAGEVDDHAAQDVSAKSSVVANIFVKQDGKLVAFINGYPNTEYHELTVPRGVNVRVLFHNESGAKHRLTARLGTFGGAEAVSCTTAVNKGKEAFLDFKIPRSNAASTTPLVLVVPGLDGQQISVIVP
jgi:hypothetical protein